MNAASAVQLKVLERTGANFSLDMHIVDIMPLIWKLVESYEIELNKLYSPDDTTSSIKPLEDMHGNSH